MPSRKNNPDKMKDIAGEESLKKNKTRREEFSQRIKIISNEDLLQETLDSMSGDDWDGCFSKEGDWDCKHLQSELRKRLTEFKFLK